MSIKLCATAAAVMFALSSAAAAEELSSAYTQIDAGKTCRHKKGTAAEDYGTWSCAGYGGVNVWLGAGDQRMYVSFGPKAADQIAAGETLAGFNDFYKGAIEWRLEKLPNGKTRPFAAIARWNRLRWPAGSPKEAEKAKGQVLVVTRLGPGGVCHAGYVDATLNPNANELAREIADKHTRNFTCEKDKRVILGKTENGDTFHY